MATSGKLIEELSEQLSCAVCLEKYVEPKVLACLHSFCKRCLEPLVVNNVLPCPSCREITRVSEKGVQDLRDNFFINGLLDMVALHSDGKTSTLMCSICDEESHAVSLCQECAHYMCDIHNISHTKSKMTKHHKVYLLDDLKSGALKGNLLIRQRMCPYHDREELKMFCETCDETICRDCTMVTHRNHDYNFVKDASNKHSSIIRNSVTEAETLAYQVKKIIISVTVRTESLRIVHQSTKQEIMKAFQGFSNQVEARKNELLQTAEIHASSEEKKLEAREEKLKFSLNKLQNSIKFTKQALESQNDVEILGVKKQVLSRFQDLKTELTKQKNVEKEDVNLKFSVEGAATFKQALQQLGEITFYNYEDCPVAVTVKRHVKYFTVIVTVTAGDDEGMYFSDNTMLVLKTQDSKTRDQLQKIGKTDYGNLLDLNVQARVNCQIKTYDLTIKAHATSATTSCTHCTRRGYISNRRCNACNCEQTGLFYWGEPLFLIIEKRVREVEYQSKLQ